MGRFCLPLAVEVLGVLHGLQDLLCLPARALEDLRKRLLLRLDVSAASILELFHVGRAAEVYLDLARAVPPGLYTSLPGSYVRRRHVTLPFFYRAREGEVRHVLAVEQRDALGVGPEQRLAGARPLAVGPDEEVEVFGLTVRELHFDGFPFILEALDRRPEDVLGSAVGSVVEKATEVSPHDLEFAGERLQPLSGLVRWEEGPPPARAVDDLNPLLGG